jgi:hypothetical protein
MHLVQLLLPLYDARGKRFDVHYYQQVSRELTERFGGLTAFSRAPAEGIWERDSGHTAHDDVIVYEVMVDELDHAFWTDYRQRLERRFEQDELVVRAHEIVRL